MAREMDGWMESGLQRIFSNFYGTRTLRVRANFSEHTSEQQVVVVAIVLC